MNLFSMEGGESAYRADFWVYGAAVPLLLVLLITAGPVASGCCGWAVRVWVWPRGAWSSTSCTASCCTACSRSSAGMASTIGGPLR